MREVLPGRLWFGNANDARDISRLHQAGVVAIVDVAAEEPPVTVAHDMTYCRPYVPWIGMPTRQKLEVLSTQYSVLGVIAVRELETCIEGPASRSFSKRRP